MRGNCVVCKSEFTANRKTQKYCSRTCMGKDQQGRKMPHSAEWEARRLAAVRKWASSYPYPCGYKRPKEHTEPMLLALKKAFEDNPEKYRAIAISNLPKDIKGAKNGNWKNGATPTSIARRSAEGCSRWRKDVLARDGRICRLCGDTENIQVHHILSVTEWPFFAAMPMNGVVLCRKCHYENDEYWQGKRVPKPNEIKPYGFTAHIATIPHKFQVYDTVGNWTFFRGVLVIFVSDMGNNDYEYLVSMHEMIEAWLCKKRGIAEEDITAFDMEYERNRPEGDVSEPGDAEGSPYRREHQFATKIERLLAEELDVDWKRYSETVENL